VGFSGTPFNTLVLVFVASTLLAVGLGTTSTMLRRTIGNAPLLLGALAANMILIPALGWGLAEILAPDGPRTSHSSLPRRPLEGRSGRSLRKASEATPLPAPPSWPSWP
jgi:hypothetical protein